MVFGLMTKICVKSCKHRSPSSPFPSALSSALTPNLQILALNPIAMQSLPQPKRQQDDSLCLGELPGIQQVQLAAHRNIVIHQSHNIPTALNGRSAPRNENWFLHHMCLSREVDLCHSSFNIQGARALYSGCPPPS